MKNYTVRTGCEVAGRWREGGETVAMTDEQAMYLVPPFGNVLIPPADAATPAPEATAEAVQDTPAAEAIVEATGAVQPTGEVEPVAEAVAPVASEEPARRGRFDRG